MKTLCMHSVILTELGVAVFDDNKCVKSVPFTNPAREYVELKKERGDIGYLEEFLSKEGTSVFVNDSSLLKLLKKRWIEAKLMEEEKIAAIQSSKLKFLINSGITTHKNRPKANLRLFSMQ